MDKEKALHSENKEFFDNLSSVYDPFFGNWQRGVHRRAISKTDLPVNKKVKLLDVGCGTGNLLAILKRESMAELYGIDLSEKMLKKARNKLGRVHLKIGNAENLKYKDKSFDYVFSVDAFHHYSNQQKAMHEFYRVLKNGGKLMIVDLSFGKTFNKIFQRIEPGNTGLHTPVDMRVIMQKLFSDVKTYRLGIFTFGSLGKK